MSNRFGFRVWDKDKKEYCDRNFFMTPNGELGFLIKDSSPHWRIFQNTDWCIIEQCTGLKDKNGKLIYEGDIVCYDDTLYSSYATKMTGVVVYRKAAFCYKYSDCCGGLYQPLVPSDDFWQRKTEIVGNVHDMEVKD